MFETQQIKLQLDQLLKEERKIKNNRNINPSESWVYDMFLEGITMSFGAEIIGIYPQKQKLFNKLRQLQLGDKHGDKWITQADIELARSVPIANFLDHPIHTNRDKVMIKCPFGHSDSTPSMCIYQKQNTFHCFSCQTNGDVIEFLKKKHNLKFNEAIRYLIKK